MSGLHLQEKATFSIEQPDNGHGSPLERKDVIAKNHSHPQEILGFTLKSLKP